MAFTPSIPAGEWAARAKDLKDDGWQLVGLCGLDRLRLVPAADRFAAVVHLLHHERKERQSVQVIAGGEPPTIPSVVELWPTANFMERETYDLFGIHFDGHPNLTRILMPDEWEGHPLRKDYGVGKVAIDFIEQPVMQIDAPGQGTTASESDTRVDRLGQVVEEVVE